jgi:hypothetical protein
MVRTQQGAEPAEGSMTKPKRNESLGYADPFWTKERLRRLHEGIAEIDAEEAPFRRQFVLNMHGMGATQNQSGDWFYQCSRQICNGVTFTFDMNKRDFARVIDCSEKRQCACYRKHKKIEDM